MPTYHHPSHHPNRFSDLAITNIRQPTTWLDDHTGGAATLYIGQQMKDQNSEWLLEFWNRSIRAVWSLDGTAQGPGPVLTPDPNPTDGALTFWVVRAFGGQ